MVKKPPPDDDRIITSRELLERIPLNRSTIGAVREGRFPPPIQLTASRIGWRWSCVLAWIAARERHPVPSRPYFGSQPKQ
jgi:predicted DNA-binding transcriptional regulator AlpA